MYLPRPPRGSSIHKNVFCRACWTSTTYLAARSRPWLPSCIPSQLTISKSTTLATRRSSYQVRYHFWYFICDIFYIYTKYLYVFYATSNQQGDSDVVKLYFLTQFYIRLMSLEFSGLPSFSGRYRLLVI